ncbi:serine/arginine-rich splicing factor 11-like [Clavelina lepadiformis]|uniref:RRM domain-containing protein n=1 Tax=Clavelina lepadiformis TaxID=159417 RepID=A0ABP0GGF3_CLALP
MDSYVVQVTNVAPTATKEQVHTLFSFLGSIDEFALYPNNPDPANPGTKVCFIKYNEGGSVGVAQHLTNTVFIDRPLICVPYTEGIIPDESVAMQFIAPANAAGSGGSMDPAKLDEIRRTIYVGNLDSKTATAEQLMSFFSTCGEVKFVRMAGDETQPTRFAFVEFADVENVQKAIQLNGVLFGERPLKINHSNNAIVKPPGKNQDATSREIDEAMRRVREAQSLISKALEPDRKSTRKRSRSRSRSRHRRHRSRSRDRSRRRRSRSRSHGRSRRSRSKDRRRSRRSRSRSRDRRRRKSRSRSPRRRSSSRSPNKKGHRKDRKREKDHKRSSKHRERSKNTSDNESVEEKSENKKPSQNGNGVVEAST